MKYYFDLDNTICKTINCDYENSIPIYERIEKIKELKQEGHSIFIWTERGTDSKQNYTLLTVKQLETWGIKYDQLIFGKPNYDIYVDDKSINVIDF